MKHNLRHTVQGAAIAALYAALTYLMLPFSSGAVQLRAAEALTVLPVFTPAGVWGLSLGCFLANLLVGAPLPDILFGTLATLLGAWGTRVLRSRRLAALACPVIANTLIIPFLLRYVYGMTGTVPFFMLTVGVGEMLSAGVLGGLLGKVLDRTPSLFREEY